MEGSVSKFIGEYHHKVRFYEVDPYGIVHHSVYLLWAETGLQEFAEHEGLPGAYTIEKITCKYIFPARSGDDITLRIRIRRSLTDGEGRMEGYVFAFDMTNGRSILAKGEIRTKQKV